MRPTGDGKLRGFLKTLNANSFVNSCAATWEQKVYFAMGEGGSMRNNVIVEYDTVNGAYMLHRGIEANCFLNWQGKLLFGGTDGHIYQMFQGHNAAGGLLCSHWATPQMDLGIKGSQKAATLFYTDACGQGKLRVEAEASGRTKAREFLLDNEMKPIKIRIPMRGRTMKFTFKNVEGSHFTLHRPQIKVEMEED